MSTVAHILKSKPDAAVHTIEPSASVYDALRLMAEKNIGALVVVEHGKVAGILSERDYARKVVLLDRASKETLVRDIMSPRVLVVQPHQSSQDCMGLMTQKRLRHLPVMEGDKLVGLISIGDVVKDVLSDQQFIIEQLEHYIAGER